MSTPSRYSVSPNFRYSGTSSIRSSPARSGGTLAALSATTATTLLGPPSRVAVHTVPARRQNRLRGDRHEGERRRIRRRPPCAPVPAPPDRAGGLLARRLGGHAGVHRRGVRTHPEPDGGGPGPDPAVGAADLRGARGRLRGRPLEPPHDHGDLRRAPGRADRGGAVRRDRPAVRDRLRPRMHLAVLPPGPR